MVEAKLEANNKYLNKSMYDEPSQIMSKNRLYKQYFYMLSKYMVSNYKAKGENGGGSSFEWSTCALCWKNIWLSALPVQIVALGVEIRVARWMIVQHTWKKGREVKPASHDGPSLDTQKKTRFYALHAKDR